MPEFAYNNAKNASTGHTSFEPNYGYYLRVSFKVDTNPCSWSETADKLLAKLQELMTIWWHNLYQAPEFQKQAFDKGIKPKSYASENKIWLNIKYNKTKQNRKFEDKLFELF